PERESRRAIDGGLVVAQRSWLTCTKLVNIESEEPDLGVRQPRLPGRHLTLPAAMDRGDDGLQVTTVDPRPVGQIGCPDVLIPPGVVAMAGGAVCREHRAPGFDPWRLARSRGLRDAERPDEGGNIADCL